MYLQCGGTSGENRGPLLPLSLFSQCRRVLQWSYTWAFYAFAPPQPNNPFGLALTPEERLSAKNIFEDSQEQVGCGRGRGTIQVRLQASGLV